MNRLSRNILATVAAAWMCAGCNPEPQPAADLKALPMTWAQMGTYLARNTPSNSPTYASRVFGYMGVTQYETVVHSDPRYASLGGQLTGLDSLPVPDAGLTYSWELALNAGQAYILKNLYQQTADSNLVRIDSLEQAIREAISDTLDIGVADRSEAYGRRVAEAIYAWSQSDGGHRGYLRNFDKEMEYPEFPGSWKPPLFAQSFSHFPLHPHWGDNRTFSPANRAIPRSRGPYFRPSDGCPRLAFQRGC